MGNTQNQLPITNSQLPITNYQFPIPNSQFPAFLNNYSVVCTRQL
ncbi:alpha/beta hydrolase [Nostoc sp. UHCC 0702]|nr:alpha/beta hydrolase [Nostoc sp. UHCC 0702]